ncbi:MAG TPA: sigma-70 family RNA polymerase sigma factor [Polyangiaceae bacterium]
MTGTTEHEIVRQLFVAGQGAWPTLPLAFDAFAAHCQLALVQDEGQPLEGADLFLCCACAQGIPEALRAFEAHGLSVARAAVSRIDARDDFVRDTLQELWSKLLVGTDARVRTYSGRGPLSAWLRVAATRVALDRQRVTRRGDQRQVELTDRLAAAEVDMEAALLRARFGIAFQDALRASITALSKQERNVLRMHVVGHCSIDEIGRAYQVHRATAARWIERARARIYSEVRDTLCVAHQLTASEFQSLATLLGAELELSLGLDADRSSATIKAAEAEGAQ